MIRDPDPLVVANSLLVLDNILADEGGIIINWRMCQYLTTMLQSFVGSGKVYVLRILLKYHPRSEEECMFMIKAIDGIFDSYDSAAVTSAMDLFSHITQHHLSHLRTALIQRLKHKLLSFIVPSRPERTYALLDKIYPFMKQSNEFAKNYKSFYCGHGDPIYIKVKKIQILSVIADQSNWEDIVDELEYLCTDSNNVINKAAITSLAFISKQVASSLRRCLDFLLQLLLLEDASISNVVLSVLQSMSLKTSGIEPHLVQVLMECRGSFQTSPSKAAFVTILGDYGTNHEETVRVIEEFIDSLEVTSSCTVLKLALLTVSAKLFLKRPAETQFCLGRLLEYCMGDACPDVSFKAAFYHSLLFCDKMLMKRVVFRDDNTVS